MIRTEYPPESSEHRATFEEGAVSSNPVTHSVSFTNLPLNSKNAENSPNGLSGIRPIPISCELLIELLLRADLLGKKLVAA